MNDTVTFALLMQIDRSDLTPTRTEIGLLGLFQNRDNAEMNEHDVQDVEDDEENDSEGHSETDDENSDDDDNEGNSEEEIQDSEADEENTNVSQASADSDEILAAWIDKTPRRTGDGAGEAGDNAATTFDAPSFDLLTDVDKSPEKKNDEEETQIGPNLENLIELISAKETIKDLEERLKLAEDTEKRLNTELAKAQRREKELEGKLKDAEVRGLDMKLEIKDSHKRIQDLEKDYNARLDKFQEQENDIARLKNQIELLTAHVAFMQENNGAPKETEDCIPISVDDSSCKFGIRMNCSVNYLRTKYAYLCGLVAFNTF